MVLAVGCGGDDGGGGGGLPTTRFLWDAAGCPDLTPADDDREAAVIIDAEDTEFGGAESFAFDCGDGDSLVLDIDEGTWDYFAEAVDLFASAPGTGVPENCFGDTVNENCLYYTTDEDEVLGVDTLIEPDSTVDFDLLYGFGNFDFAYTLDTVEPDDGECAIFSDPAADEIVVTANFYTNGFVEDFFLCGGDGLNPTEETTRDLPLGDYDLEFEAIDSLGDTVSTVELADPADCPGNVCTLLTHLETFVLEVVIDLQDAT
jgi:hypothetical protein